MLHIISKASLFNNPMDRISDYIKLSDTILLTQDAIYIAYQNNVQLSSFIQLGGKVCALKPDVLARGMDINELECIDAVDFNGFVDLTARCEKSLSW